jgi:hypothetical protein
MDSHELKPFTRLSFAVAFLLLAMAVHDSVASQTSPQGAPQVTDRERNVTDMERSKYGVAAHDAAQKQFNDDFLGLQTVDADMVKVFATGKPPDYKRIADDAADIKKRATRIRDYLMLPSAGRKDKQKKEAATDELDSLIPALKDRVQSFVKNPTFQQQDRRADYRDLGQARRDVDDIIEFSARVKTAAEKMGTAANQK